MLALDLARFIPLIIVIAYAACSDKSTKNVPNKLWLYAIYGFSLTIIESALYLNNVTIQYEAVSITITFAIALTLFFLKAWGGADAKALMTIAVSAPLFPSWSILSKVPLLNFFPIVVFYLACIATMVYSITHKTKEPIKKQKVQFLPFLLAGLIVSALLW